MSDDASRSVGDHVRPTGGTPEPGVYRVVGTDRDAVVLLRVAAADGTRRHTGAVVRVSGRDREALEPATNPDANRSVVASLRGTADGTYWSLRVLVGTVVARPLAGGIGVALIAAGVVGDAVVPIPDLLEIGLAMAGVAWLLYLSRGG